MIHKSYLLEQNLESIYKYKKTACKEKYQAQ